MQVFGELKLTIAYMTGLNAGVLRNQLIKKTNFILDFLDSKAYDLENKKVVHEWFDKRDLNNLLEFFLEKKNKDIQVKKFKI